MNTRISCSRRPWPNTLLHNPIQARRTLKREVLRRSRRRNKRNRRIRRPRRACRLLVQIAKRVPIERLPLPTPATNHALQAAIRRLTPLLTTRNLALLRQALATTTRLRHSHEHVILRRPALIDARQSPPPTRVRRRPQGPRPSDLALRREMRVVLVRQAHSAARTYLRNRIDRVANLRVHGAQDSAEAEVVGGGQLVCSRGPVRRQRSAPPIHRVRARRGEARVGA